MKILLVHNYYKSRYIGGEDIVYKQELEALSKSVGIELYHYEAYNDSLDNKKLIKDIWGAKKYYNDIYELVKKNNIDIVHVHNFFPLLTPSVFNAARDAGAKVVHTLHNYRWWCINGIFFRDNEVCENCTLEQFPISGIMNKCFRDSYTQSILATMAFSFYRYKNYFENIDSVFVLTRFQYDKLVELGVPKEKIKIKPNFIPKVEKQTQETKKGYLFVGRLEEGKGINILLDVWEELDHNYELTIVGDGPLRNSVVEFCKTKSNIHFLGKQAHDKVEQLLARAKYLIHPALMYETFGLTIIEAFAVKTPVIGFNIGTRKDLIIDHVNGFLCEPNKLKETIEASFNYNLYDEMSSNAYKSANDYEESKIIDIQKKYYQELINKEKV